MESRDDLLVDCSIALASGIDLRPAGSTEDSCFMGCFETFPGDGDTRVSFAAPSGPLLKPTCGGRCGLSHNGLSRRSPQ